VSVGDTTSPTFSVVVPTRYRPRQLATCLAALARLDYPREGFEVVVVIDGEDPRAERVAGSAPRGLTPRVVVQEHRGAPDARNRGSERAAGEFIAFTDDDCAPDSGWLAALERMLADDRTAAVGGCTLNGTPGNIYSTASQAVIDAAHAHWNRGPAGARFFASNNFAVPAEGFRSVGGFDASFGPVGGEDRELCDRWVASGRQMRYQPEAVVHHVKQLTMASFIRQHYSYGRGARILHRIRARRRRIHNLPEPGFYAELARQGVAHAHGMRRVPMAGLLAVSQAANAAGYFLDIGRRNPPGPTAGL
jgi:GT2 family glycosyltransferase